MEMKVRGWREERIAWTRDTTGRTVPVVTGLTKNADGEQVAAIAIGVDGPTAILDGDASQLRVNIRDTIDDLKAARKSGQ